MSVENRGGIFCYQSNYHFRGNPKRTKASKLQYFLCGLLCGIFLLLALFLLLLFLPNTGLLLDTNQMDSVIPVNGSFSFPLIIFTTYVPVVTFHFTSRNTCSSRYHDGKSLTWAITVWVLYSLFVESSLYISDLGHLVIEDSHVWIVYTCSFKFIESLEKYFKVTSLCFVYISVTIWCHMTCTLYSKACW